MVDLKMFIFNKKKTSQTNSSRLTPLEEARRHISERNSIPMANLALTFPNNFPVTHTPQTKISNNLTPPPQNTLTFFRKRKAYFNEGYDYPSTYSVIENSFRCYSCFKQTNLIFLFKFNVHVMHFNILT